jgi:glucosamine--fructose-6-phosphate aminotransferase (isomerizing)
MCGIVAATARAEIIPVLIDGLLKLEYRGYDSAGLAFAAPASQTVRRLRATGRVAELQAQVAAHNVSAHSGIAHTRWATHGAPSERNAHPHMSGELALVHNGIIENHMELRAELSSRGYAFESDTDTESVAHLIHHTLTESRSGDLFGAVREACARLKGAYALAVMHQDFPGTVVVAREGSPLLLGLAEGAVYVASDASALVKYTRRIVYLENGDFAQLRPSNVAIVNAAGQAVERKEVLSLLDVDAVELHQYRHYMQKEIFEQPAALAATLELAAGAASVQSGVFGGEAERLLAQVDSVLILACGTSCHAGQVARYWLESLAGVPCTVEVASEYRYRRSVPNPRQLVVAISQSGETADTLAALRHAKVLGHTTTLAVCNVPESAIVREAALRFITRAGPEIGVASTKAFTTQLAALFLLTLVLARRNEGLTAVDEARYLLALRHLPVAVEKVLALEPTIAEWGRRLARKQHALFLGRGMHYPIALEGALKLKEISYIHAEAYAAGELKHGPLALVDADMPVIAVAPNDALIEKLKSNLQEVRARGGELYVFADANTAIEASAGVNVLHLPEYHGELSPVLHVVPLQLLSYHVALVKGTDVDKPRNLAKSVTVE